MTDDEVREIEGTNITVRITRDVERGQWRFERRMPGKPSAALSGHILALHDDGIESWEDAIEYAKGLQGLADD